MNLRQDGLEIFHAALDAADPVRAIQRHVRVEGDTLIAGRKRYDLRRFHNVYVVGAGKAGATMALAVEKLLGKRIRGGLVSVKEGHLADVRRIPLHEAGHPVPDNRGVAAARDIATIAQEAGKDDLILCLISGGASALLPFPAGVVWLAEKQKTTRLLLQCGATIHEINTVRKHISGIKGGWLAALAYPATVISLILSDVIGDNLDVIGSGLTAPDPSTFADALGVLRKYGILDATPQSVRRRLTQGAEGALPETPKPGDPAFAHTQNLIVGSNDLAMRAAAEKARALGYRPLILSSFIEGETREIAKMHAAIAKEVLTFRRPVKPPCCLISGGETTVTLRGKGKGGRNQEFALAAAIEIEELQNLLMLSGGTDGTDGPTDAAGALCDGCTAARAREAGLSPQEHLSDNNAYPFFDQLGDLIRTGPTGTNVMDIRLILVR